MPSTVKTTQRWNNRALISATVKLAFWRFRQTWELLLVTGVGIVHVTQELGVIGTSTDQTGSHVQLSQADFPRITATATSSSLPSHRKPLSLSWLYRSLSSQASYLAIAAVRSAAAAFTEYKARRQFRLSYPARSP